MPLTELSTIKPPQQFIDLWQSDLRAWWCAIANLTNEPTAALVRGLKMFDTENQNAPATIASCESRINHGENKE